MRFISLWSDRAFPSHTCAVFLATVILLYPGAGVLAQTPGDVNWDYRFGYIDPSVGYAEATQDRVVVAGGFPCIEEHPDSPAGVRQLYCVLGIWDGVGWTLEAPTLSGLETGNVIALYRDAPGAVVGSTITTAEGHTVEHIASWTGSEWQPLGSGVNGRVRTLRMSELGLYVGGDFTEAGGAPANRIAVHGGAGWHALVEDQEANGVDQPVLSITSSQTSVYIGGSFNVAGNHQNLGPAVRWDPNTSTFSQLGNGFGGYNEVLKLVHAFGATIALVSGSPSPFILPLNGEGWDVIPFGRPVDLYVSDSGLIYAAGGYSLEPGADPVGDHSVWDGTTLKPIGVGTIGSANFITGVGENVYAPVVDLNDGRGLHGFGHWNGSEWSAMGRGLGRGHYSNLEVQVRALAHTGTSLYAAGRFNYAGADQAAGIARWDGTRWHSLPGPDFYRDFRALVADGEGIIAGGSFQTIDGIELNGVGRWTGSAWQPMGSGICYGVTAITSLLRADGSLFAGGHCGGSVFRWDGDEWNAVGSLSGRIEALAADGGMLYAGGQVNFEVDGQNQSSHVAVWDGSAWSPLGGALAPFAQGTVRALAVLDGELYALHEMSETAATPSALFRWRNSEWEELAQFTRESVPAGVATLYVNGNDLFVGGNFTHVNEQRIWRIARWNGTSWSGLGSGVWWAGLYGGGSVDAITGSPDGLWLGGFFSRAGNTPSSHIALWKDFTLTPTSAEEEQGVPLNFELHPNYPNPFNPSTTIRFDLGTSAHVTLKIYDVLGREVATLVDEPLAAGRYERVFEAGHLPSGLYLSTIQTGDFRAVKKMVLVK